MPATQQFVLNTDHAEGHTLICVFLRGGADTMNIIAPVGDDRYHSARPTLSLKASSTLKVDAVHGMHPAMQPLEAAFKDGRFGFVNGVGVDSTSGSHFECQDQMEHGDTMEGTPAGGGWLGRYLRARDGAETSPLSAVAIGTQLPESLRGAPSVSVLQRINDLSIKAPKGSAERVSAALQKLYGADVTLLGQRGQQTLDLFRRVTDLQNDKDTPANGASYPTHAFGSGLRELARLIKARVGLEVACIDLPGWDTHFLQGTDIGAGSHATNVKALAEGLAAFELDLRDQRKSYTVMVMTEFGRRFYENASLGTDHGRGFCFMALGDRVKGGRLLGQQSPKTMDESNPLGPGGQEIDHDYRDVFAEVLAGTLGLNEKQREQVFPGAAAKRVGLFG